MNTGMRSILGPGCQGQVCPGSSQSLKPFADHLDVVLLDAFYPGGLWHRSESGLATPK